MEATQPTLLLLVRHGVTPTTGQVLPGRAPGLHLSEAGLHQAAMVAERLEGLPLAAIYSSPLERARETAAPSAARFGLDAVAHDGLIEADFGAWTGRRIDELTQLPEWETVQKAPSTFRFPGGESFVELQSRMIATMERLRAAHPGGVVVCFSHADPIKAILTHALGTHLDHFQRVDVGTGSISAIQWPDGAAPIVRMVNSTGGPLAALRSG